MRIASEVRCQASTVRSAKPLVSRGGRRAHRTASTSSTAPTSEQPQADEAGRDRRRDRLVAPHGALGAGPADPGGDGAEETETEQQTGHESTYAGGEVEVHHVDGDARGEEAERGADPRQERALVGHGEADVGVLALVVDVARPPPHGVSLGRTAGADHPSGMRLRAGQPGHGGGGPAKETSTHGARPVRRNDRSPRDRSQPGRGCRLRPGRLALRGRRRPRAGRHQQPGDGQRHLPGRRVLLQPGRLRLDPPRRCRRGRRPARGARSRCAEAGPSPHRRGGRARSSSSWGRCCSPSAWSRRSPRD